MRTPPRTSRRSPRFLPPLLTVALLAACADATPPGDAEGETAAGILSVGESGEGETSAAASGAVTTAAPTTGDSAVDDDDDDGPKFDLAMGTLDAAAEEVDCDPLVATIRDMQASHPDFETYSGSGAYPGLVEAQLGADHTPVLDPTYAGAPMITSAATFHDWYHDVAGVNLAFPIELVLEPDDTGLFIYDNSAFFPIDAQGFGDEGNPHNFHFTTEVHTSFTYQGGEVFTFRGDDDLWMFVDGQLALDIGGLHSAVEDSIEMDSLGLTLGETYPMDIFHAERHTNESNFRIETTIECFVTPPPA